MDSNIETLKRIIKEAEEAKCFGIALQAQKLLFEIEMAEPMKELKEGLKKVFPNREFNLFNSRYGK